MRILVTGGSGFIGSHVVDQLLVAGHDVEILDLAAADRADVRTHRVDLDDLPGVTAAAAGMDAVFHLAAFADVNDVASDPIGAANANIVGTARVWEACRRNGVARAVLASTVWVYGASAVAGDSVDEEATFDLTRAGHLYTSSKLAAELVVQSYHELYGQDFTILSYGIPYGPRMRPSLVIPKFVAMARAGEAITIQGDGSQHRNYVYVEDLARAHALCLAPNGANRVFNLEGPERITIRALVGHVGDALGVEPRVTYLEARPGDYGGATISAERARRELGWEPVVPFREGLRRYVEWQLAAAPERAAPEPARLRAARGWPSVESLASVVLLLPAVASLAGAFGTGVAGRLVGLAAAAVATATNRVLDRWPRHVAPAPVALVATLAALWMTTQLAWTPLLIPLAALLGWGLKGVHVNVPQGRREAWVAGVAALGLGALAFISTRDAFWFGAATAAAVSLRSTALRHRPVALPKIALFTALTFGITAVLGSAVGATSASAWWFGRVVGHGPRDSGLVAVTFNGVQDPALMTRLVTVLDRHGAKASFFLKRADPMVTTIGKTLLADGQLVAATGSALRVEPGPAGLGVCPSYYRPARGWHTPLLSREAGARAITLITWDVQATSRGSGAPERVATAVLRRAKPGSIVSFDFSAESNLEASRLVGAVQLVLRGLEARGLTADRLDHVLNGVAYGGRCA